MLHPKYFLLKKYYFQLSENIRTAKQIMPCIIVHFLNIIFTGLFVLLIYMNIFNSQFYQDIIEQIIYILVTIALFIIELFIIM